MRLGFWISFSPPARWGFLDSNQRCDSFLPPRRHCGHQEAHGELHGNLGTRALPTASSTHRPNAYGESRLRQGTRGPEPYRELQIRLGAHTPEHTPERMSDKMNRCQMECQSRCEIDCQGFCQKNASSAWAHTGPNPMTSSSTHGPEHLPERMSGFMKECQIEC